ncbi:uncharacterized protein L199_005584 [Kwoniella botswanensis]|uniref:uncharacterized protein n=1 Tax=Kwoniella botswanensis TaxID=1268659 RepID=UPI00315C9389
MSKRVIRTKSTIEDRKVSTEDMFEDEFIQSYLEFRESGVDFIWDNKRKLLELHFDGDNMIMCMENGATIMAFD